MRSGSAPACAFIDMARNILCTEFLEEYPDATDLFFIDDDIGFPAEKVVEFLDRPQDVVAGIYPKRQDDPEFPVVLKQDDNRMPIEKDGLYLAANIPGGFVRIKRHVIEKLASVSEKYKFNDRERGDTSVYNIFELGPRDGYYWGEDSIFAKKLQDNGFEIWVDPKIEFEPPRAEEVDQYADAVAGGVHRQRSKTGFTGSLIRKRS
jgi:hypothetical protein